MIYDATFWAKREEWVKRIPTGNPKTHVPLIVRPLPSLGETSVYLSTVDIDIHEKGNELRFCAGKKYLVRSKEIIGVLYLSRLHQHKTIVVKRLNPPCL